MSEDSELALIMELQEKGVSEEVIEQIIESQIKSKEGNSFSFDSDYDPKAVFKEQAPKPDIFKSGDSVGNFKPVFILKSDRKYKLNGEERNVRKLNMKDVIRIMSKLPKLANYMGYNAPEMLVDDITGKYRFYETVMVLFERAFGDYDYEKDKPTDFSLCVLEEIAYLLSIPKAKDYDPVDYLLSCDPEEVFEAVSTLIAYNQTFFLKLWENSGIIKEICSLIFGTISKRVSLIKQIQKDGRIEESLTESEILE